MDENKDKEIQNEENCTHDCSTCSANCSARAPQKDALNPLSRVGKVYGIVSGKGGVGKSLVTSLLAVESQRRGFSTAILDADVTGPSIPKMFGLSGLLDAGPDNTMLPAVTKTGIQTVSVNLLMKDVTQPVVWRGPVISGVVKQFWSTVVWDDVDYMFIDCPPGTSDVTLTVFQSLPVDGLIIVTSPQDLVSMIVAKAVNMARVMRIPIVGVIENFSYAKCPDCGKEIEIFGKSRLDEVAKEYALTPLGRIPVDPLLTALCDKGAIELFENDYITKAADAVLAQ